MANNHTCPVCDRSFGSTEALRSHRRAKKHFDTSGPAWWRAHAGKLALGLGAAGRAANLEAFFRSIGGTLRDSLLDVQGEGTYRTGEHTCGDRPGRVAVYVDGDRIEDPSAYVPGNGEDVRIVFEPVPAETSGGP